MRPGHETEYTYVSGPGLLESILHASKADIIADAEECSNMDQFTHYENIYYNISATVGKDM